MCSCLLKIVLLLSFLIESTVSFCATPTKIATPAPEQQSRQSRKLAHGVVDDVNRRSIFETACSGLFVSSLLTPTTPTLATAAETNNLSELLLRLRSIPTFCITTNDGVPFMIFDGPASATGYFFLSFQVASQALQDARQKDSNAGASEIWSNAKIIVVPLAVALQLALRKTQREALNNGIKFNTYNDVVASSEGVDDAKAVEGGGNADKWVQKGRVPLFYVDGLKLANGREPRYFNQADLLQEWEKQYPGKPLPKIQLVEMIDLYRNALARNDLTKIANLAIVPVAETNQVASELLKSSTTSPTPSYNFNKVYLVGSSKG